MPSKCFHCGDNCDVEEIKFDEKLFCCNGCKVVYDILKSNDLCTYYDLDAQPGFKYKVNEDVSKFDYLDNSEVVTALCDFESENRVHITFYAPQMHCHSCVWLLEKLPVLEPSIIRSSVHFIKKTIHIEYNPQEVKLSKIVTLLTQLGYEPVIRLEKNLSQSQPWIDKKTIVQLGISGFCFGNIMFFSFPEYVSGFTPIPEKFSYFFGIVSLFLATVLLFVGAKYYLRSSFDAIKHHKMNINIPISLGIIALYGVSAVEIVAKLGTGYLDSLAGFIFFLLLGRVFQQKTFDHLSFERDYKSYFPMAVTKVKGDKNISTPITQLKVKDRIQLKNEEIIPADGVLLSEKVAIDYSFVTGESDAVKRKVGELLYAGGRVKGAGALVEITKTPDKSYLTKLWNRQSQTDSVASLSILSDRVASYFTWIVLLVAFLTGGYWLFIDLGVALRVFTSVLIVACPCALALAIPFAYGNMVRHFGSMHFFLKDIAYVEKLTEVNLVVFDKTGTLTTAEEGGVEFIGEPLSKKQSTLIQSLVSLSNHPMSVRISDFLPPNTLQVNRFKELIGKGLTGFVEKDFIKVGSADFIDAEIKNKTAVYVQINDLVLGYFDTKSILREGLKELFEEVSQTSEIAIVSGDSEKDEVLLKSISSIKIPTYFNQSPFDKQTLIESWSTKGTQVMMLGDGLNDAGALHVSGIGVAITDNLAHFTPASDAILHGSKLVFLPAFIKASAKTKSIVKLCFGISFSYNLVGLYYAAQGLLSPVFSALLMPISSITVVLVAILFTNQIAKNTKKEID